MIKLVIKGQIRGGKNNIGITRTGRHYPHPEFVRWREDVCRQITSQWPHLYYGKIKIEIPCIVTISYWAGDKRRRDVPAMIDALWHVFERGAFVADDSLFKTVHWIDCGYDKTNPRVKIEIEEL